MAPTKYGDLGKAAKDLFDKNYEHGKYSLEVKSKAGCMEFTTKGHQDNVSGAIKSSHESTFQLCKLGKLKETFTPGSDKVELDLENKSLVKDVKFNFLFNMGLSGCPIPDPKKLKINYTHDSLNLNLASNFGSKLDLDAVAIIPKLPFDLGLKAAIDLNAMNVDSKEIAMATSTGSLTSVAKSTLNNDLCWTGYNKINDNLALATSISHQKSATNLAIAAAIKGACGSSNQVKIADNGRFAVSHISPLQCGAKLTVSGEFDAFNLGSGNHKIGAGLKFDL